MSGVAAILEGIAAEASGAGAQATLSPGQVPVLLSRAGPVLLVGAPKLTTVGLSGRIAAEVPLLLFVPPPANWDNTARALAVLDLLLPVFPGEWSPTVAEVGDLALPAYTSTIGRKT